jgi:hypothetical protein
MISMLSRCFAFILAKTVATFLPKSSDSKAQGPAINRNFLGSKIEYVTLNPFFQEKLLFEDRQDKNAAL